MEITINVNGKSTNAVLALPPAGTGPGVLLLHAWWGLNPFFKSLCERIAEQGFVCLSPDMFQGDIAQTVTEAEALAARREEEDHIWSVLMAAKDMLLAHPACTSSKVGAIGFSFGAAWVLVVAGAVPEQIGAGVLFYGVWRAKFESIQAPFLGHFSNVDEWEPYENTLTMEQEMRAAGMEAEFHIYPGLPHWFMEADRPEYDPQAAELAWKRTFTFLKEKL